MKEQVALFLASGAYSGYFPFAPGTIGTLVGILLYFGLARFPLFLQICIFFVLFGAGVWSAGVTEQVLGKKDHPVIVIDEVVGYQLAMFLLPATWFFILAAFFVFRFFDIVKPFAQVEAKAKGGWGVMADDLIAAFYTNIILFLVSRLFFM